MKFKLLIIFAIALGLVACENQEFVSDDFGSENVFFPFQTPVRTIIQGDYDIGFNDNDNNSRFEIGVRMSGVIENKEDRKVHFELAPELIDATALGVDTVNVKILPSSYYTIEQESPVTIPSGSEVGRIPIQLEDSFFDDPLSFADFGDVHYVIPLKITNIEGLDSLLSGTPIVDNPIKIKLDDWSPAPKDYTLFGIKYINKYHGQYLRRGGDRIVGSSVTTTDGNTETIDIDTTSVYRNEFVVRDELVPVFTIGRNSVDVTNRVRRGKIASIDVVPLDLVIDENDNITITSSEGSNFEVTGSGKFVVDGDEWGGEPRNVIYLEYEYKDVQTVKDSTTVFGTVTSRTESILDLLHIVKDTLVLRNRDIKFEEFMVDFEKSGN